MVLIKADEEKTKVNSVISTSNILATKTLMSWESKIPIQEPTTKETHPIKMVSNNKIFEIWPFPIPSVI